MTGIIISFFKQNKQNFFKIKLFILIIINTYLFFMFWKYMVLDPNSSLVIKHEYLDKYSSILENWFQSLGFMIKPNTLKIFFILSIIIIVNLILLYFNIIILVGGLMYSSKLLYKSYTNYLINKENITLLTFKLEHILSLEDKTEIFKNYVLMKNLNIPIELEQNILEGIKILENKQAIIQFINFKYQEHQTFLLKQIELQQMEALKLENLKNIQLNNQSISWYDYFTGYNNIDLNLILKVTFVIIIIGSVCYIVMSGNNNIINTAGDMSKEVNSGVGNQSNAIQSNAIINHLKQNDADIALLKQNVGEIALKMNELNKEIIEKNVEGLKIIGDKFNENFDSLRIDSVNIKEDFLKINAEQINLIKTVDGINTTFIKTQSNLTTEVIGLQNKFNKLNTETTKELFNNIGEISQTVEGITHVLPKINERLNIAGAAISRLQIDIDNIWEYIRNSGRR